MATLAQIHSIIAGAPDLRQRFQAARIKSAWYVANEDPGTANHANRLAWANKIFSDYDADLDYEYRWLCSNATIQAAGVAATDTDVEYVVAVFLDQWADHDAAQEV